MQLRLGGVGLEQHHDTRQRKPRHRDVDAAAVSGDVCDLLRMAYRATKLRADVLWNIV